MVVHASFKIMDQEWLLRFDILVRKIKKKKISSLEGELAIIFICLKLHFFNNYNSKSYLNKVSFRILTRVKK